MSVHGPKRDGRYSWVIVTSFFLIMVLTDGLRYTFGLYFLEFLEEFGAGRCETAWIGSMNMGFFNVAGPVIAYISHKFGVRVASFIGSLLSCVGFFLSAFTPNIYFLYFTFGILQGLGFGLMFLSGSIAVGKYFLKNRALALGIAYTGSGVGTFAFVPLAKFLIDKYTWRGSMLILAGVALQGCVLSMLYRPLTEGIIAHKSSDAGNQAGVQETHTQDKSSMSAESEYFQTRPLLKQDKLETDMTVARGENKIIPNEDNLCNGKQYYLLKSPAACETKSEPCGSLANPLDNADKLLTPEVSFELQTQCDADDNQKDKFKLKFIEDVVPKKLVMNSNFLILMVSCLFFGLSQFIPYSMTPDFALSVGCTPEESGWLIAALGVGGMAGRLLMGKIADLPCFSSLYGLAMACILSGVLTMITTAFTSFWPFVAYCSLVGLFVGSIYILTPMLCIDLLGDEMFGTVVGCTMTMYGMALFLGPPVAGWMFDAFGDYKISFLFAGSAFFISGSVLFLVPCTKDSRRLRSKTSAEIVVISSKN